MSLHSMHALSHFLSSHSHSNSNSNSMATINPLALSSSSKSHTFHFTLPSTKPLFHLYTHSNPHYSPKSLRFTCKATQVSVTEESSSSPSNWVPVVPLSALPRGERRVIIQDNETILLLWYKDQIFAIENRSPAEGAYSEGLLNAKLTQDGCIVCPTTDSTFDLRTGEIKEWYPNNPVLRVLTPALRTLFVFPVKTDEQNIYISMKGNLKPDAATEIVFSGKAQPGVTATDVNVDEVKMVVDEGEGGFGFTRRNEIINGKAAVIGFLLLLDFELLTEGGRREAVQVASHMKQREKRSGLSHKLRERRERSSGRNKREKNREGMTKLGFPFNPHLTQSGSALKKS